MKYVEPLSTLRRLGVRRVAVVLAMSIIGAAHAAQTDIASTPIVTTTAALVKPNIMLLMDASGSMGRTHMPDEVETLTGPTSVGYKSSQCNALYYNPAQQYFLPKRYDGTPFPTPSFTSAPYAGFGSYYAIPDLSLTDLSSQFVAYDGVTLEIAAPFPDTPQAAYYYVYTGAQTLSYATSPCNDPDTGATRAATGGGTWTKVVVGAGEQQNFAIWYSYYRTRLALIKSAASLAFTPLNDTKRVGFITVQPKDTPGSAAINPIRYLPLGDFNSGQKNLWFNKLFSQRAGGASPAREGLARVGRYYGGKEDSINAGMPATGADDPIQYACQQNFTIMTTDGYWNGQTESKGPGLYGGGLQLDGVTAVGQQDGDPTCPLSDPYCPRPIWDGAAGSTHVVTNKTNAYSDGVCSLAGKYRSTFQTQRQVTSTNADTTRTIKRTVQYTETKTQALATTTQTTSTQTYDMQTTVQYAKEKVHYNEERYQIHQWQEQTTKVTQQFQLQTSQVAAQTFQTRQVQTRTLQTQEQWTTAKSQWVTTTTQYVMQTDQYRYGAQQVYMHEYQTIAYTDADETGIPLAGDCVPSGDIKCKTREVFGPALVDPSTCTTGPGPTVGPAPGYLKTTCINGPLAVPYGPVASCVVGTIAATSSNNWTTTTCDRVTVSPAAPFNGTCTVGTTQVGSPDYSIFICTRPAANNTSVPVASCGATSAGTAPDWITTTCTQPPGPTNFAATPSLPCTVGSTTDGSFVTTTCAKPLDTSGYVATCTADPGTTSPFIKTTCAPETLSDVAVADGTCTPGTVGAVATTCPKTAAGPYLTPTPVDPATCTTGASTGSPDYYTTTCTNPPANNQTVFTTAAGCGPLGVTAGTAPSWITRNCTNPAGANNATTFSAPAACVPNAGTTAPYVVVTCTTATIMADTIVDPATCPVGVTVGGGPNFVVNHCDKVDYVPTVAVSACTPLNSGPPDYIITDCGYVATDTPVSFCVLGPLPDEGVDKVTCVKPPGPNNAGPTQVATCTPAAGADPTWVTVTCAGSTTTPPVAVTPASCPTGTYLTPTYILTCATDPAGAYPTATPVAACTPGTDGAFITTTCTYPPATNYASLPVAPCTEGTTIDGATQVKTTCTKVDSGDVYVPTATCTPVTQTGTGPEITCTTTPTFGTPVASCAVNAVGPAPYFDTTSACHSTITSPMADYAGLCTAGPTGTPGESASCNLRPIDVLVADSGCVDGSDAGTGLVTQCTTASGSGHLYSVVTTKTVTTTPYSGGVPAGPDVVATTSTGPTPVDGVCYPTPQIIPSDPTFPAQPPVDIAGCSTWPCTSVTATAGGSQNSLADVSQYYYKTDLRPGMPNNVPSGGPNPEDDNATHQHMTTFAIALGVSGTLQYRPDYRSLSTVTGDFADIRTGAKNWPMWPDPLLDYTNSDNYNNPKSIDDYWHTAVNGRGRFFNANNPTSVVQGLGDALAKIDSVLASGSPIGTSTLQPVSGNNFAYATSYQSGTWEGDLQASTIDLATGAPTAAVWSAKALLGAKTFAACDNRQIFVMRGSNPLGAFTWNTDICPTGTPSGTLVTGLNATEQAFFGALNVSLLSQFPYMTDGTGSTALQQQEAQKPGKLVNFLRGQRGLEDFESNSLTKLFRHREAVLGDIVDSQPVFVQEPFANYQDAGYMAYKASNASRTPMVYVGANDGMLHAFYATLDPNPALKAGQEAWAVIPSSVLSNMYKLADDNYKRDGHQFYVDGTPSVGDAFIGGAWKTILVGGLNAGGKGYYALDITTPGVPPTPLWEFKQDAATCPGSSPAAVNNTADCNLGLSFGKPVITKLAGTWVVMVTSGYNNVNTASNGLDGVGFLYVLNAADGKIIYKIATGAGNPATPSGLGQINNYVDNVVVDNTTLRAYGGDVLGNMWRFDFTPSPAATLLASARDLSNNPQPITVRPELAELDGKPFVMFGTGKLLGATDVTDPQVQSVYGFRDTLALAGPLYPTPRTSFRPMQVTQVGTGATAVRTIACSGSPGDCGRTDGWVLDLAEAGERVNVEMKLVLGALVFASNVPEEVPCSVGGHSWFNQIDFRLGAPIPGTTTSEYLSDSLNVGFTVLELPPPSGASNPTYTGVFRQSKATNLNRRITPPEPVPVGHRISWREIAQ